LIKGPDAFINLKHRKKMVQNALRVENPFLICAIFFVGKVIINTSKR